MNINEALRHLQSNLHAPKSQFNKFGGYNYRSCEDILNAVKPLLAEAGAELLLSDEIILLECKPIDRVYVKATATFKVESEQLSVSAYAREPLDKKGSDDSQITGATSSYARKYALNGLFLIDDAKDADSTNTHGKEHEAVDESNMAPVSSKPAKSPSKPRSSRSGVDPDTWTCKFGRSKGKTLLEMAEGNPADVTSLHSWLTEKYDPSSKFAETNKLEMEMIADWIDEHTEFFPKEDDGNQEEDLL